MQPSAHIARVCVLVSAQGLTIAAQALAGAVSVAMVIPLT